MQKRSSIKEKGVSQLAKPVESQITDEQLLQVAKDEGKNPAAVLLGRLGGLKGGKARAAKLTARKRSQIARKAAKARWENRGEEENA